MSPTRGKRFARTIRRDARDVILFCGGMLGIANEATRAGGPRESLLILFGGMIGVIPFLHLDAYFRERTKTRDDEPDA